MKKNMLILAALTMALCTTANALEGDQKLACEAILCLSVNAGRPAECEPAIRRYYSISHKKFSDTLRARRNFLELCPKVSEQPDMATYKDALVNGSGRCDAATINQATYVVDSDGNGSVGNVMPSYCQSYFNTPYQQSAAPCYVGTPSKGGHWVEAPDYEAALRSYNASLQVNQ